jgi:hypothetical protein
MHSQGVEALLRAPFRGRVEAPPLAVANAARGEGPLTHFDVAYAV